MRIRMLPLAVGVAILVLLVAVGWAVFGDRGSGGDVVATPDPTGAVVANPTATPTVAASPPATAAPEPSAALWGEFPVPTRPASAIPWDQVGSGWFLLAFDAGNVDEFNATVPHAGTIDDTLTLVSPAGDLYHVRELTGERLGPLMGWGAQGLLVLDVTETAREPVLLHGHVDAIDLETGGSTTLVADAHRTGDIRVLPDGRTVMWTMGSSGGFDIDVRDVNLDLDARLCPDGEHSGQVSALAPDGNRAVCLLPRASDGKTDVVLISLVDGSHTPLDVFTYDYQQYWTDGWWDANSVIVQRVEYGPTEEEDVVLSWAYDVSTRQIRDLDARMADGTPASRAFGLGDYRVVSSGTLFEAHSLEGVFLATLPCEPEAVSGDIMLAQCTTTGGANAIEITNLETGATSVVAEFVLPIRDRSAVFPAPGGERRRFFWR